MRDKATAMPGIPASDPRIGPFLQNPGTDRMTIAWIRADSASCTLAYGRETGDEKTTSIAPCRAIGGSGDFFYQATLTGLEAGTQYRYSLRCPERTVSSAFRTFPEHPDSLTFIAYGDNKGGHAMHRRIASRFGQYDPAFILHSGDMTDHGCYEEYHPLLFQPIEDVIDHIPFLPCRGNHEGNGDAYRQVFSLPQGDTWYSFDYGNTHFIVLDTTGWRHERQRDDISRMRVWLDADLSASRALWTIAVYHEPSYDLGWRKDDWGHAEFLPIMRKHGVDVTLSAHAHGYQRLHPMKKAGENELSPVTHIISAGAGASIGHKSLEESGFLAADARRFNYMVFDIRGEHLRARVFSEDDDLLDLFELTKPAGAYDVAFAKAALWETDYWKGGSPPLR
jgi:hypothetical protein